MGKKLKECAQMNGNVNWTEVKRKKHYMKSNKVTLQISNDRKSNNNL